MIFILTLAIILGLLLAVQPREKAPVIRNNGVTKELTKLKQANDISEPLPDSVARITKKPFGLYVEPGKSTVPNERFIGFHSGTDFEVFDKELTTRVPIYALCSGELIYRRIVEGYGGVIVQDCLIGDQSVTVLYGHLDLDDTVTATVAQDVKRGDEIGALGAVGRFTDNERRHLHLGIHRGSDIDLRGYVEDESELLSWINYLDLMK